MKMNTQTALTLLLLAGAAFSTRTSHAAPGDLDTNFGGKGKVITDNGYGTSVAVQPDGKILVAGAAGRDSGRDISLSRYTDTGLLDTTFGGTGRVDTEIGGGADIGYSVAVQSDGKILVAGVSTNFNHFDFALIRYTGTGSLDSTFGDEGIVTTPISIGSGDDYCFSVVVQPDGKILVAGYNTNDFALVRYTDTGSLDTTFGGTGIVITDIGGPDDQCYSMALQADGKILVAGYTRKPFTFDIALVRYTDTGSLDTTFGGTGIVTTDIGGSTLPFNNTNDRGTSIAVQADGKILVSANFSGGNDDDFALVRYTETGSLDTTFGGTGIVTTDIGGTDIGSSVAVQADGKILVAGYTENSNSDFALVRYSDTGSLDPSFGGTGIVTTDFNGSNDVGYGIALQPDGRIVVAGVSTSGNIDHFALVRYESVLFQPDIHIGLAPAPTIGDDIYGLAGAGQVQKLPLRSRKNKTVYFDIENDGAPDDSFTLNGVKGDSSFSVTYLTSGSNVTAQALAGTLTTGTLAPGEEFTFTAKVKAKTALARKERNLLIRATSTSGTTQKDAALIKAKITGK